MDYETPSQDALTSQRQDNFPIITDPIQPNIEATGEEHDYDDVDEESEEEWSVEGGGSEAYDAAIGEKEERIPAAGQKKAWYNDFISPTPDNPYGLFEGEKIRVFIGTWNMHGKPPPRDLCPFIIANTHHIYAIGTQECERSIEASLLIQSKEKWINELVRTLGDKYILLRAQNLMAIHLIIFVRVEIMHLISDVRSGSVATGLFNGNLGNKGGVGISFLLGNNSYLFINSHLAAHQYKIKERNADFGKINMEMKQALGLPEKSDSVMTCDLFDYVFWFGDLNYRINGNRRVVDAVMQKGMTEVLIANDQLRIEKAQGNIFQGFQEGELNFRPTYKFSHNGSYDQSRKQRIPAWTDRILFKFNGASDKEAGGIELTEYDSCEEVATSDHRPVYAQFLINLNLEARTVTAKSHTESTHTTVSAESSEEDPAVVSTQVRDQAASEVCTIL